MGLARFPILLSIVISFGVVACAPGGEQESDPILKSYRLIDTQRTDEAIELLEVELSRDPKRDELRIALASAYAHKAGMKIQKFVGIVTQSERLEKLIKSMDERKPPAEKTTAVDEASLRMANVLKRFSVVAEIYAGVPSIESQNVIYLQHAIHLLSEDKSIPAKNVVYRLILQILLFKHFLNEKWISEPEVINGKKIKQCSLSAATVNDNIVNLGRLLINIVHDVGYVDPNQAAKMKSLAARIGDEIASASLVLTGVSLLDEAAKISLAETAKAQGFGKMVECDSL